MATYTFYPSISGTIIEVDLPSTGAQIQELVTTIRDWEDELENMEWPKILDASGKEELGGGVQVGITTILRDAKLKFADRGGPNWILCDVFGGNLVATSGDVSTYINPIEPSTYVTVTKTASSSATLLSSFTALTSGDLENIGNTVWNEDISEHGTPNSAAIALRGTSYTIGTITFDSVNGVSGTGYPVGSTYSPSNNLTDTLLIMMYGKVDELVLRSDLTVGPTHDVSNLMIKTIGLMGTEVTLEVGCDADKTAFRNVNLVGEINGGDEILVYDCSIGNFTNFNGIMNNVVFAQSSELILDVWAEIIQASCGGEPTNEVEINIGTAALNMSHWAGNLKLTNKTGSNRTVINCDSGNIIIDSTCVAGTIQILGNGTIEADNSGAGCTIDLDGFSSIENISIAVWESEGAVELIDLTEDVKKKVLGLY